MSLSVKPLLLLATSMAFEAFPSDAVESFNDPGIYYVHENGKLRSPPGLGHTSHTASTPFSDSGLPKLAPFNIGVSPSDGATCFIPRSLFQQVINFVARNLWRVESLVGFPDIVGEQLFEAAQSQGIFTNKQLRFSGLRLFVEAYPTEMLSSLNLRGNQTFLDGFIDEIVLFSGLLEVDLGECSLGEDHQIWPHIGSLPCLQRLGLRKTGLSDGIMQKLTTPLRLMGKGPKGLQVLDLSGNGLVTDRSVRFVKAFHHLEALDVTGCCISPHGLKQLQTELTLRHLHDDEIDDEELDTFCRPVENIGWASKVIDEWINETKFITGQKNVPQGCPKARKFYSSKSKHLGFMDVSIKTTLPVSTSSPIHIRLVRTDKDIVSMKEHWHQSGEKVQMRLKDTGLPSTMASERFAAESQGETTVDRGQMLGNHVLCVSNQGPSNLSPYTEEESMCGRLKSGLKVKLKRKRKRCQIEDETKKSAAHGDLEDDDRDLMNSYLNIRSDGDVELDKTRDRSKLMRAMDSSHW
ncbi:leucine-rich repeat-containing protein 42-like isoform X1 [Lytechinus variegatus]|uniref:leucine-rich repeat-containing protein 42-like isoform X1 n=2 Tax=Lytechinus variegatus TaxID=7654 RepID=UPI001BB1587B|nr:leucine-rich repeat-containing protein 42-like isoform X1 [Lytechinus variegatus]